MILQFKKTFFIILWTSLLAYNQAITQNQPIIDSLNGLLKTNISIEQKIAAYKSLSKIYFDSDSNKVVLYTNLAIKLAKSVNNFKEISLIHNNLAWLHLSKGDFKQAKTFFRQNLDNAQKGGYKAGIGRAYNGLGIVNAYLKAEHSTVLDYFHKSLKIAEQIKDSVLLAKCYNNIGLTYRELNNNVTALKYQQKSIGINEKIGRIRHLSKNYNNIGVIYYHQKNYAKAIAYYEKSLTISRQSGKIHDIAGDYHNIGSAYKEQGNYEKALTYIQQGQQLAIQAGDKSQTAFGYRILGNLKLAQKNYPEAEKKFLLAYKLYRKIDQINEITILEISLGEVAYHQKKYVKAIQYLNKGIKLARKYQQLDFLRDGVKMLAKTYEAIRDFEKAYQNLQLFKAYSDSLFNEENTRKLTNQEAAFNFNRKEDSLKALQTKKELQLNAQINTQKANRRTAIIGVGLLSLLLLALGVFYLVQRRSKHKLTQAHDQLLSLDQFKHQMLGMIVHDLKNPLNSIIGLSEKQKDPQMFKPIYHSGQRLHHLVMNILDVQRLEDNQMLLNKSLNPLSTLISEAVAQVSFVTKVKNQFIEVLPLPKVSLEVDMVLITRVLVNLLINATKYSPNNQSIQVKAHLTDTQCEISVTDYGVGITSEFIGQVFDKYAQSHPQKSGQMRSTGLGLTYCKLAVEAHEGEIGVTSVPGQGSTFWFRLPLTTLPKQEVETTSVFVQDTIVKAVIDEFSFTSDELAILRPVVTQIRTYEIYQTSHIMKALGGLGEELGSRVTNWKVALEDALFTYNEERFEELIEQVGKPI
ncbi:MAG TPA: hypothetical protein DCS93_33830 [Microscillaceae bacterium]|nr:hypothetical protein [Microscillaceae bacterium]